MRRTYILSVHVPVAADDRKHRFAMAEDLLHSVRDAHFYALAGERIELTVQCMQEQLHNCIDDAAAVADVRDVTVRIVRDRKHPAIRRIRS